ncbi:hypothetical protein XENOCAPTIV_024138 [Xenoophorus captivus]|uniref:SAM domain-containing protein n=1 Tax=Xenoophorus captivus TaxID=1517983 RepID=A0ABV0RM48_9TELE
MVRVAQLQPNIQCRCYRLNGFSLLKRFPLSADGACGKALDQPVGEWLEHVGLPQYESKFLLNGFDDLRFMVSHLHHVISEVGSTLFHSRPCLCQLGFIYLFMSPPCSPTLHLSPTSSAPFITLSFSTLSPYPHNTFDRVLKTLSSALCNA